MIKASLLLLSIFMMTACSTSNLIPASEIGADDESSSITVSEYRIGIDDQLSVRVWRNPELTVSMPVRPDGKISVPLIGDIQAGGRTPESVADDIQKRLSVFVRNPNVTVIITDLRNFEYISRIRVTGAVETPSSFPFRQGMTVLDAVLEAGGVNEFAAPGRAKLYRKVGNETRVYDISLDGILNQGELSTNYPLKPGDIITVPERFF